MIEVYNPQAGGTYDPKAKKRLDAIEVNGVVLRLNDRVRYTGSSPCFVGKSGVLVLIKKEWTSKRTMSRAGFAGRPAGYSYIANVLWDGTPTEGPYAFPQGCRVDEIVLEPS